ncbi:MAG: DUF4214 domain-containing protein [Clostridiales bacterium]|nr:DUF4214 domain-containing protein [Clostridiales bacterium]
MNQRIKKGCSKVLSVLLSLAVVLSLFTILNNDVSAAGTGKLVVHFNSGFGAIIYSTYKDSGYKTLPPGGKELNEGYYYIKAMPKTANGYNNEFVCFRDTEAIIEDNPFQVYVGAGQTVEYEALFREKTGLYIGPNIPSAGTFSVKSNGTVVASGEVINKTFASGTPLNITATPAAGFRFVRWEGDSTSTNATTSLFAKSTGQKLTAVFELIPKTTKLNVTPNIKGAGTITLTGPDTNETGESISKDCVEGNYTLKATANSGYKFIGWDAGDGVVTDNPFTFEHGVVVDDSWTAKFEKVQTPNPDPIPDPGPGQGGEGEEYDNRIPIKAFIDRLYTLILGRDPEAGGLDYWTDQLYTFNQNGGEVAMGFITSQELRDRHLSDSDYIDALYLTFFARSSADDPEGKAYWMSVLADGADRNSVAWCFVNSQEWADTCATFGIISGTTIASEIAIMPTEDVYRFVERIYNIALGRTYDEEGLNYWAVNLAGFSMTGEYVGAFFFLSDEMYDNHLDNGEYLMRLYKTFMDRNPLECGDEAGYNYWMGRLNEGMTREQLVYSFTRSPEFIQRCYYARIIPYGEVPHYEEQAMG